MKIIIYPTLTGIAVVHPTGELPFEEVARKDVPAGVPYLIVDDSVIPSDRAFRGAWEADFSAPHGTGIGALRWFIEQVDKQIAEAEAIEPNVTPTLTWDGSTDNPVDPPSDEEIAQAAALALADFNARKQEVLSTLQAERVRLVGELIRTEGVSE